jgi:tetratricopeptide (TPR) repeat protein
MAYYDLAVAYNENLNYPKAFEYFNKTIAKDTTDPYLYEKCLLGLGFQKNNFKDYKGAIKEFNHVLKLNPNNAKAYNNRGSSNYGLQNYKEALKDMDKAIEINPQYAKAYNKRGDTKIALKDYYGGIEDLNKSIQLDPYDPASFFHRAQGRSYINDLLGAIDDYTKAIQLNPNFYEAIYERGMIYSEMKNYEKADLDFKRAELLKK